MRRPPAPRPERTALDEGLCHQIPEPFPTPFTDQPHWRESLFFIAHRPDGPGDVVILTMASFPTRGEMDALQLGRIGDTHTWGRHARELGDDPHSLKVGPVTIDIVEPYKTMAPHGAEDPAAPVALRRCIARTTSRAPLFPCVVLSCDAGGLSVLYHSLLGSGRRLPHRAAQAPRVPAPARCLLV